MNRHVLVLVVSTVLALGAYGCGRCMHKGMTISATVVPPAAAASHPTVEIHGTGFTPNTMVTISFRNLPAADHSTHQYADTTAITNDVGTFSWSKDTSVLPALDPSADPNGNVLVSAKEVYVECEAEAVVKVGALMNAPTK